MSTMPKICGEQPRIQPDQFNANAAVDPVHIRRAQPHSTAPAASVEDHPRLSTEERSRQEPPDEPGPAEKRDRNVDRTVASPRCRHAGLTRVTTIEQQAINEPAALVGSRSECRRSLVQVSQRCPLPLLTAVRVSSVSATVLPRLSLSR